MNNKATDDTIISNNNRLNFRRRNDKDIGRRTDIFFNGTIIESSHLLVFQKTDFGIMKKNWDDTLMHTSSCSFNTQLRVLYTDARWVNLIESPRSIVLLQFKADRRRHAHVQTKVVGGSKYNNDGSSSSAVHCRDDITGHRPELIIKSHWLCTRTE